MANAYYEKNILGELSDAQTLPSTASEDSENMVYIGGPTGGQLWINVYANNAIVIVTGKLFYIELEGWTSDVAANATSPFSITNSGGANHATGILEDNAHYWLLHKTTGDAELQFDAGDLITQCAIPEDMFRLLGYDYVQLRYETDDNESSERVDAFVWIKPS